MSKHPFKLLWSFVATLFLTGFMAGSQSLGMTRINIPYMLGTMLTADRDRARLLGFVAHFLNGWGFGLVYMRAFDSWGRAGWWRGAAIGVVHALFVLMGVIPLLPGLHPRMAGEEHGPTPTKQLEPPGFMALNYGRRTPVSVVLAHILYGAILGAFYRPER
jgi:uncharacterized membrane protein YagU involved in acid resistance